MNVIIIPSKLKKQLIHLKLLGERKKILLDTHEECHEVKSNYKNKLYTLLEEKKLTKRTFELLNFIERPGLEELTLEYCEYSKDSTVEIWDGVPVLFINKRELSLLKTGRYTEILRSISKAYKSQESLLNVHGHLKYIF